MLFMRREMQKGTVLYRVRASAKHGDELQQDSRNDRERHSVA